MSNLIPEVLSMKTATTARVVAALRAAGLTLSGRFGRGAFSVRQMGADVGVASNVATAADWVRAMTALEAAGLRSTYRSDAGMGSRWAVAA